MQPKTNALLNIKPRQWLSLSDWQAAAPQIEAWQVYSKALPENILNTLCFAVLEANSNKLIVVEHPWQAQWLMSQCVHHIQQNRAGKAAVELPHIVTLAAHIAQSVDTVACISPQTAALELARGLKPLTSLAALSNTKRFELAQQMVTLLADIANDEALGGESNQRLQQSNAFLSREALWLGAAAHALNDLSSSTGQALAWQENVRQTIALAKNDTIAALFPAPHPGTAMQIALRHLHPAAPVFLPMLSSDTGASHPNAQISSISCNAFEHEAQTAADWVTARLNTPQLAQQHIQQHQTEQAITIAWWRTIVCWGGVYRHC